MMLPAAWIDKIFSKLSLAYGRDFMSRWEGLSVGLVKADWAEELGPYVNSPEAIAHALSVLPHDKPPTVFQFRDLCAKAPKYAQKALPPPKPDAAAAAKVRESFRPVGAQGNREWAIKLREREQRSKSGLTPYQRQAWREALDKAPEADES